MKKNEIIFFTISFLIFLNVFSRSIAAASSDMFNLDEAQPFSERRILLNIPTLTLKVFQDGKLLKVYPVAVGKSVTQTPIGEFQIKNKVINPYWYPKDKPPVVSGPENPLGTRWLGLQDGYGIHGNNNPNSIGSFVSLGCIRLYNKDIEELFDMVKIGTKVTITYETVEIVNNDINKYVIVYPDVYNLGMNKPEKILSVLKESKINIPEAKLNRLLNLIDKKKVFFTEGYIVTLNNEPITTNIVIENDVIFVEKDVILDSLDIINISEEILCKTINEKQYISINDLSKLMNITLTMDEETESINMDLNRVRLNGYFLTDYKTDNENKPLIPLRVLAEALSQKVVWDSDKKEVKVNEKPVKTFLIGSRTYITTKTAKELLGVKSIFYINEKILDLYFMEVVVDDKSKVEGLIFDAGEFLIPLRSIAESLGYNVSWEGKYALLNEKVIKGKIIDNKTYINVKDIGEIFDVYVGWKPKEGIVNIISGKRRN